MSRSNNLIINQSENLNINDNNYNNNQVQNRENSGLEDFKLDKSDNTNPNKLSKSNNNPNSLSNSNNNNISNKISRDPLNKIDDNENKPLNNINENENQKQEAEIPKVFTNLNLKVEGDAKIINAENNENDNIPQNAFLNKKPVVYENKIQNQFKNIFGGNDYFENNYYRKRVLYLAIFCIVVDILNLQVLW